MRFSHTGDIQYVPIKTEFHSAGFEFKQYGRDADSAIYQKWKPGHESRFFEVIWVKRHNGFKIPGENKMAPPAETYPTSEDFGTKAWCFNDLDLAMAKFHKISHTLQSTP